MELPAPHPHWWSCPHRTRTPRFVFIIQRNVLFAQQIKCCCLFCSPAMSVLQLAPFCDWPSCVSALYLLYSFFFISCNFVICSSVKLLIPSLLRFPPTYFCSSLPSSSLPSIANHSLLRVFSTPGSWIPHPLVVTLSVRFVSLTLLFLLTFLNP